MEFSELSKGTRVAIANALGHIGGYAGMHGPGQMAYSQSAISEIKRLDGGASRNHLRGPHKQREVSTTGIYWGKVEEVDIGGTDTDKKYRGAVKVEVPDLYGNIYARPMSRYGHFSFDSASGYSSSVTGDMELPQKGDFVLIAIIQTPVYSCNTANAVILGVKPNNILGNLLLDKNGNPEPLKRIDVHPSFQWRKVNAKGDLELKFPDGSFVAVQEAPGSTPPNAANDLTENRNPPIPKPAKTITISHASGAWVRIHANGMVDVTTPPLVNIELNCGGDAIINAENANVNANGNANVIAATGDVQVEATVGNATVKAGTKATVDAPQIELVGVVTNVGMTHTHPTAAVGPPSPPTGTVL